MTGSRSHVHGAEPRDQAEIVSLAVSAGLFTIEEADVVDELMSDYFSTTTATSDLCLIGEWTPATKAVEAVAYAQPLPATDRAWELVMLATSPHRQRHGLATALLAELEWELTNRDQRLLVVNTSATSTFASARAFYSARGYTYSATVPDYYAQGDDLVVYTKPLGPT